MRLDKLMFLLGYGSRNTIKKMLLSKQVIVDNHVVMQANKNVDPFVHTIEISGKKITTPVHVYYMLNKPKGVVSAVRDSKHQTVIDLVSDKDKKEGMYPIGRLDRDAHGLLLLSDNGPLGYKMLHPTYHVHKIYEVRVNALLTQEDVKRFEQGITFLDGYTCQSAVLTILKANELESIARVTIGEGKFHQVKKMFLSVGKKVVDLKRIQFGPLQLDETLSSGCFRPLTKAELEQLKPYF